MMKMRKENIIDDELIGDESGVDINSKGYQALHAAILLKAGNQTAEEKRNIDLNTIKFKMMDYLEDESLEEVLLGTFIKEYLSVLKVKQKVFAAYINWNPGNLTKLLNGERKVNYELAMILGNTFNVDPSLWLRIQDKNELVQLQKVNASKFTAYSLRRLYEVASLL